MGSGRPAEPVPDVYINPHLIEQANRIAADTCLNLAFFHFQNGNANEAYLYMQRASKLANNRDDSTQTNASNVRIEANITVNPAPSTCPGQNESNPGDCKLPGAANTDRLNSNYENYQLSKETIVFRTKHERKDIDKTSASHEKRDGHSSHKGTEKTANSENHALKRNCKKIADADIKLSKEKSREKTQSNKDVNAPCFGAKKAEKPSRKSQRRPNDMAKCRGRPHDDIKDAANIERNTLDAPGLFDRYMSSLSTCLTKILHICSLFFVLFFLVLLVVWNTLSLCLKYLFFTTTKIVRYFLQRCIERQGDLVSVLKISLKALQASIAFMIVDALGFSILARYLPRCVASTSPRVELPKTAAEAIDHLKQCEHENAFQTLLVDRYAGADVIKKHYRKIALLVHPDKLQGGDANKAIKILNSAYHILSDEKSRDELREQLETVQAYQQQLRTQAKKTHNALPCMVCGDGHEMVKANRDPLQGRFCRLHNTFHQAKDCDVWVESYFGSKYLYLCTRIKHQLQVFYVKKWGYCQAVQFDHVPTDHHHVLFRYKLASFKSRTHRRSETEVQNRKKRS